MILHHESGMNMFELDFLGEAIDNNILTGFLTALDNIGKNELKVGDILSIKFGKAFLTGGFFYGKEFKIIFLLKENPSESLEKKIIKFINKLEMKKSEEFNDSYKRYNPYHMDDDMKEILRKAFGDEISKLLT